MQHNKMSPMLREMLADVVDLDNDVSILKRMEQIVNDYKARVEGILQTADDDEVGGAGDADGVAATAAAAAAAVEAALPAPRRRDVARSPSKIPLPLSFFRQHSKQVRFQKMCINHLSSIKYRLKMKFESTFNECVELKRCSLRNELKKFQFSATLCYFHRVFPQ